MTLRASRPKALAQMPTSGPLVDRYGRVHTDLRLSVTDRCNFRCVYCMPENDVEFLDRPSLLSDDEIFRVARVARRLGIRSVRVTGGEPLVRRGVTEIVSRLSTLGFEDLSLTTNGTGLPRLAAGLAAAGLRRVNISCDSLDPGRFARMRRRGSLASTLAAMNAAEAAGLVPLKVNVVLLAGENDNEILSFVEFARSTGRIVRFIEFMPLDADGRWCNDQVVRGEFVLDQIGEHYDLVCLEQDPSAPAERFGFDDGIGEIGVIRSVTKPFCGNCDRLRVTADGALRNCLFANEEISLRDEMRNGADDDVLESLFRRSVWEKQPGHGINEPGFLAPARSMSMIGG